MKRLAAHLRGVRLTIGQVAVVGAVSAVATALVLVSALGQTADQRAVIAALRTREVIHAPRPAPAPTSAASPAPASTAAAAPTATAAPTVSTAPFQAPTITSTTPSTTTAPTSTASGSSTATTSTATTSNGTTSTTPHTAQGGTSSDGTAAQHSHSGSRRIKHVFVIVLSTPSYRAAFGHDSAARYLNSTLRRRGELLTHYHALTGDPLPDLIALVSGQTPNADTRQDCPIYSEFHVGAQPRRDGLVSGPGCIYPNTVLTIGDQLQGDSLSWRAYVEGMSAPCQHPNTDAADGPTAGGYTTTGNPFVYFHSLLDLGGCQSDDLPFARLARALRSAHRTASYLFITPDLCDSGAAASCPDGRPGGITRADKFLRAVVPRIMRSAAYRASGGLLILFTPVPASVAGSTRPARTGALVLSPFARRDATDRRSYDPYSVLRSVEDVFELPKLGRARRALAFDATVFSAKR